MSNTRLRKSAGMKIKQVCMAAVFCALAIASTYVMHIKVGFLTFDIKDAIVALAGLLFGPVYSAVISLVVSTVEFVTIGDAGPYGFLMDFLSTALFATICALVYKFMKNIWGAVIGLASSVLAMTTFMVLFNLFIVPLYTPGFTTADIAKMVPVFFLPFNLTKGMLNAAVVLILYKPVSMALKSARVLPAGVLSESAAQMTAEERRKKNLIFSLVVTAIGLVIVAVCLVVFFVFMDGKLEFFTKFKELAELFSK